MNAHEKNTVESKDQNSRDIDSSRHFGKWIIWQRNASVASHMGGDESFHILMAEVEGIPGN